MAVKGTDSGSLNLILFSPKIDAVLQRHQFSPIVLSSSNSVACAIQNIRVQEQ